ncbi:uncharacterized protein LOC116211863 [Punica granatum]|uniref:Uncharacterized protein LOC116211863 n=1 Tax=Punica granatum TaxID=22663 RepID=A0A6P8DXK9_PUNGR|nr:uncharacterized protein LOC116211863 [Punica granatum]
MACLSYSSSSGQLAHMSSIWHSLFRIEDCARTWKFGKLSGLCYYSIPGLYLPAQCCLGSLVAMERGDESHTCCYTVAWLCRKIYRATVLCLIYLLATKPGFLHAAYTTESARG